MMFEVALVGLVGLVVGSIIGASWSYSASQRDSQKMRWLLAMADDYRKSQKGGTTPMTKAEAWDWCYDILMDHGPENHPRG